MIAVLKAAARAAKWETRPSPRPNAHAASGVARGRGVATSLRGGTYNAAVAEVEVDRETGKIRVDHMIMVQDNGMTINPRALKLGIEANVVQTVSRALIEEVRFDRSNVTSLDWDDYPIIRFTEAPTVDVISIDQPNLRATGSGEPSCNPIAPAIANAVFDAVGVRLRSLPMTPDRVKAALEGARGELRGLDLRVALAERGDAGGLAGDVLDRRRRVALGHTPAATLSLHRVGDGRDGDDRGRAGRGDRLRDLARDPARRLPGLGWLGDRSDRSLAASRRSRCCAPSPSTGSRSRKRERSPPPARPAPSAELTALNRTATGLAAARPRLGGDRADRDRHDLEARCLSCSPPSGPTTRASRSCCTWSARPSPSAPCSRARLRSLLARGETRLLRLGYFSLLLVGLPG